MGNSLTNLPAIVAALGLLYALLSNTGLDLRKLLTGRNVVLIGISSWFLLEAIMLPSALTVFTQDEYFVGVLTVGLSIASLLAGYHGTNGCTLFPSLAPWVRPLDDPSLLWRLVAAGAIIGFTPVILIGGTELITEFDSLLAMRKSWGGPLARGRYGDARAAFLQLEMFINGVGPFAAMLLFDRRIPRLRRIICAIVVCWPMLRAFGAGTRSSLITSVIPVLAVLYLKSSPQTQRKLVLIALLCAPLAYQLMAAIVASRGEGVLDFSADSKVDYVGNEMFRELLFIRRAIPDVVDYQYGYVYYVQLVNPVPRFLWPDKPTLDAGLLMADMYGEKDEQTGEAHMTVSPGIIGEMYMNFGWLGVIGLSAFGGWLVRGWDRMAEQNADSLVTRVYHVCGLAVLFIMGRSFTMNMFYGLMSFALLARAVSAGRLRANG